MKATNVLPIAILMAGVTGCASTETRLATPAHELRSFAPGWERFFTVDWRTGTQRGHQIVSGTVQNRYGATATRIQLLVEGLDDKGGVLSQRLVWLGDSIEPFGTARFDVPVDSAPNYRVTIFTYDHGRGGSGGM